jgi:hypothetical protein
MPAPHRFAAGIYLVALAARLIPVFLTRGLGIGLDDMFQYDMLARSLSSGNGYRWYARSDLRMLEPYVEFDFTAADYDPARGVQTSFRAPLYPALLALIYAVTGPGFERFLAARVAQAVFLGAPLAPLTYLAARSLLRPAAPAGSALEPAQERTAQLAAWSAALYPTLVIFPLGLGTENLFFVLLLAAFLSLLRLAERPTAAGFVVAGVFLGLTALTRSVILPFAGLSILWAWSVPGLEAGRNTMRLSPARLRGPALMALALGLTLLPWVVRNSLLHGRLTGIETSLGYNLYVGYHPQSDGSFTFGPSLDLVPIVDDQLRDETGTRRALEFIRAEPGRFVPLALSRLGHFFRLELRLLTYFYSSNFFGYIPAPGLLFVAALFGLPFAVIAVSAALGAVLLPFDRRSVLLCCLVLGYLAPHIVILSEERFHLALIPFLAMPAAAVWVRGLPAVVARLRNMPAARLGLATVVLLLLVNWSVQFLSDAEKYSRLLGPEGNRTFFPY